MLYVDKRMEDVQSVTLPDDNPEYGLKIGHAPQHSRHAQNSFVGFMKKFVYYRSTKYSEMVMGDRK